MHKRLLLILGVVSALALSVSFAFAQDATPEAIPGSGLVTGPMEGEAQSLTGAGATFPQVLYTTWFSDYATLTGVEVNYQGIGSGGGIKAITDQTADFGASDGPMTDDQLAAAKETCGADILHIATALGGVVVTYNIPELQDSGDVLKFTPDTLRRRFSWVEITTWNDPALVADNPQLEARRSADCGGSPFGWLRHDQHFHQLPQGSQRRRGRPTSVPVPRSSGPPVSVKRVMPVSLARLLVCRMRSVTSNSPMPSRTVCPNP